MTQPPIRFGGDYNPEQWSAEVHAEDIELMTAAGVNLVTVGKWSWGTIQPTRHDWETGWLHTVLDALHEADIAVNLATPSASPPPWLGLLHPEIRAEDEDGVRVNHGSRAHFCASSPIYREYCQRMAQRLAQEFAEHPAVVMWHVGTEHGEVCWCGHCEAGFRAWLREKYGELDALNHAWGTSFWSQQYADWAEILLPRRTRTLVNPTQWLDHCRFTSDVLLAAYNAQAEVLRPFVGEVPVVTNLAGFNARADHHKWADHVSVACGDHYPDPTMEDQASFSALEHDLMRSIKDRPWMLMEQAMGAVSFRDHNTPKTEGQRRRDVLRAVAHGADAVLTYQFRQSRFGSERFHSALVPNAGAQTRYHKSVRQLGTDLEQLSEVVGSHRRGDVALLHDWDSSWAASEATVPSRLRHPYEVLAAWHRPLWARGLQVDIVHAESDLDRYPVVLAPIQHMLTEAALTRLRSFIEGGGHLVMGPFSAVVDTNDALLPGPFPCGLTDLLGASGEQWWPLPQQGVTVHSARFGRFFAEHWAEQFDPGDAHVLAWFEHSDLGPAILRSPRHKFTYIACDMADVVLDDVIGSVLHEARVRPDLGVVSDPGGAEVHYRDPFTFVLNNAMSELHVGLRHRARDALNARGYEYADSITLGPGDSKVLVAAP